MRPHNLLFGIMLVSGCLAPGSTTKKPQQDLATRFVWNTLYGQTDDPPEVDWYPGENLFGDTDGFTWAGWKVDVADKNQPLDNFFFSRTALAHELMHERTFERTGDVDALHVRGDWTLAEDADIRLDGKGL